jgi:hypothetical protein
MLLVTLDLLSHGLIDRRCEPVALVRRCIPPRQLRYGVLGFVAHGHWRLCSLFSARIRCHGRMTLYWLSFWCELCGYMLLHIAFALLSVGLSGFQCIQLVLGAWVLGSMLWKCVGCCDLCFLPLSLLPWCIVSSSSLWVFASWAPISGYLPCRLPYGLAVVHCGKVGGCLLHSTCSAKSCQWLSCAV